MARTIGGNSSSTYNHRLSDVAEEPKKMLLPIEGYEKMPLLTLEEAMEPLTDIVPKIAPNVYVAKYNSEDLPGELSVDQSAAIMLYTMGHSSDAKPLYHVLNSTLRSDHPDRHEHLKPWFLYLKLFITALSHLPSYRGTVYRGVKQDLSEFYTTGKKFVWWGFSSCTKSLDVLQSEIYLGRKGIGTIFIIDCFSGKEIRQYSHYNNEDEVLLVAARQFIVVCRLNPAPQLWIIQIKEIEPPFPFLKTDSSISSNLESSHIDDGNNLSATNICLRCLNTIVKASNSNVETTTEDLAYNVKFDKDTMTHQESTCHNNTITAIDPMAQTKVIRLQENRISIESAEILAENIRKNNILEILYLVNNDLKDDGLLCVIQAITDRSHLRVFVIGNGITDVGAKLIAETLSKTPEMMSFLNLDENLITAQGLRAILQAVPMDTKEGLRTLSVKGNTLINDECIDDIINILNENRSLRSLYLERCNLSEDGKNRLQQTTSQNRHIFLQF